MLLLCHILLCKYPASRAFLSGKSFSMYIVVRVSGISRCRLVSKRSASRVALLANPPFEGKGLSTSCKRSRIVLQRAADSPAQEKLIDILDCRFLNLEYRFFILNG